MNLRSYTYTFVVFAVAAFALGTIQVMKLRVEADVIGGRIQRLERSMAESKKELDTTRRQYSQAVDTLQLQLRIGDTLKPPAPEQVVWVRYFPSVPSNLPLISVSPRTTAREIAFLQTGGQGGGSSR
jgi:hypothetical protein